MNANNSPLKQGGRVHLPQHDPDPDARRAQLDDARATWVYGTWTYGDDQELKSFAETTPARETPRFGWVLRIAPAIVRVALNDLAHRLVRALGGGTWTDHAADASRARRRRAPLVGEPTAPGSAAQKRNPLVRVRRRTGLLVANTLDRRLAQVLGDYGTTAAPSATSTLLDARQPPRARPGVTVDDYVRLYRTVPRPPLVRAWPAAPNPGLTDELFASLRVAGPNPEVIARVDIVPDGFDPELRVPGGTTVADAAAAQQLFLADYAALDTLVDSTWHHLPRYVCSPRALFAAPKGTLVPVAIECERDGPVFVPGDAGWELAKQVVQVADGNHHELVSHLGRTHLLVEIVLMATRRNLAIAHPLSRLLVPHFEGTVFINDQARRSLIAPGGAIDRIFAGTIGSAQAVAVQSLATLDLATYDLPTRTKARGTDAITVYPWRDDALLLWDAIAAFVSDVVARAYPSTADLTRDTELQAWSAALSGDVAAGGLPGFHAPSDADDLTRILTLVIYTASVQHAAVNFPQYPAMSFAPLTAGSGWAPAPTATDVPSLIAFLPPRQLALQQLDTLHLLSSVHYTRLGHYPSGWFEDPNVEQCVRDFQAALAKIEATIREANRTRPAYTYLLPSLVPQSINI